MPIIAFTNNKGGVGKSTLTLNVAGALTEIGHKTLVVDLDSQANLSSVFIEDVYSLPVTVADVIYGDADASRAIQASKIENLSILPSNHMLYDIDSKLAGDDDAQFFLAEELESIKDEYDFILIDCPPNLGKATRMALVASDYVIIPIQCHDWAVKGCQKIMGHIERVQKRVNPNLNLLGININRFNSRRKIENTYHQILRDTFKEKIFQTVVKDNVPYVEAITAKLPITLYQPNSHHAHTFRQFAQEVLNRVKK